MNRRVALSIVITAAATALAADRAPAQSYPNLTVYAGPGGLNAPGTPNAGAGYNASSQLATALPFGPGMTAGNGVGVGDTTVYNTSSKATSSIAAFRFDSSGNVIMLAPAGMSNASVPAFQSTPYAISAAGITVGESNVYSGTSPGQQAVAWNASGGVMPLTVPSTSSSGLPFSYAYAVNAGGTAAGTYYNFTVGGYYAATWNTTTGAITTLPTLSSVASFQDQANAINATGTVVGFATQSTNGTTSLGPRATLWTAGGTTALQLATLPNTPATAVFSTAQANAVNNSGVSVGVEPAFNATGGAAGTGAVRWSPTGAATQLPALSTTLTGVSTAVAYSINSAGTAVGYSTVYAAGTSTSIGNRATIWSSGSVPTATELPNLSATLGQSSSGAVVTIAYSINDDGLAVGSEQLYNSGGSPTVLNAMLWVPGTSGGYSAIDLNSLLSPSDAGNYVLLAADSISNTDWVTALAQNPTTGFREEVLFSVAAEDPNGAAVPEPTSIALIVSAAVPMLARRRRRNRVDPA